MALQDLTPQLRTRLNRMERLVGLFVVVATLLLLCGVGYYTYNLAARKGWFLIKAPYFTYVRSAIGLKVSDPVKMMGFDIGKITRVTAEAPETPYNVYIEFEVFEPFYGYVWTDSRVKVASENLLGGRVLEITKGGNSERDSVRATYKVTEGKISEVWLDQEGTYTNFNRSKPYWLLSDESPALGDRMEKVVNEVEKALPNILSLTNQVARLLRDLDFAAGNVNELAVNAQPLVRNLVQISGQVSAPRGSLGEWLIPTNLHAQLLATLGLAQTTLGSANSTLTNADQTLTRTALNLDESLVNLASFTSNLNAQVQANTNMLTEISAVIVHSDELVQGLKRHWLLRSAFKNKSKANTPPPPGGKRN